MSSSPFRLVRQLSSGPDGVSYLGIDERDHRAITVDRLFLARRFALRWTELSRRLQLVAQLSHDHVLPVRAWSDNGEDPYLVTERLDKTVADAFEAGEVDGEMALDWVRALAAALAQGHRLGLVHGDLSPVRLVLAEGNRPVADLCGVRTGGAGPIDDAHRAFYADAGPPTPAGDVFALGALCVYLLSGRPPSLPEDPQEPVRLTLDGNKRVTSLLAEMLDRNADKRPSIHEVLERLRRVDGTSVAAPESTAIVESARARDASREQIGRFRLRELLGEGAMGRVYRAQDTAGGPDVALKVLRAHWADAREALGRFYREARVLSELDNPHVARFIEANEDAGVHYLAMEYIDGQSLGALIDQQKSLPVAQAMGILRDVAFALADVHDLGVVHRDIKPSNVLLVRSVENDRETFVAKLCDFGIARPMDMGAGDELTEVGIALGTPHYMSPEQCSSAEIDARSDIYALGITLFKMLVGYVPFNAPDARTIVFKHLTEHPPDILSLRPELGSARAAVLERMLAKKPEERFANGRELLEALEELARGEPAHIELHPRLPEAVEGKVLSYDFEWQLSSPPHALWPHVSNTERLNRAIGLDAIQFRRVARAGGGVETYGKVRLSGVLLDWREHPYEWVAPHRMGVLREFSAGPFLWLKSSVELVPFDGGTMLKHQIQLEPRSVLGRAAASMEVGFKAKRNLERVYQRIDRYLSERRDGPRSGATTKSMPRLDVDGTALDAFEPTPMLSEHQLARIDAAQEQLLDTHIDEEVAARLCDFLRWAPAQEVARIRPRAFARRFTLDHREVLRACLHAAKVGLLSMLWDVICPRCQVPSSIEESMRALREHGHCEACDVDFELDFGNSVEVVFRAHPEVRDSEIGTFCIGGPGHTPHVLAQVRLRAGERFVMELMLEEGNYRIAGRGFPLEWGFRVQRDAALVRWEVNLARGLSPSMPRAVGAGRQRLVLVNDFDHEVVARVERVSAREDAMTAAEVACTGLFRELFPSEALAPGQLMSVSKVALVIVELVGAWNDNPSEATVFGRLMELQSRVADIASREAGAVVKLLGDGMLLSFNDPAAAVRASLALVDRAVRVTAHTGPALATSINERLDYFGRMVRELLLLSAASGPGQLVLSEALCADPAVASLLATTPHEAAIVFAGGIVAQALTAA